VVGVIDVIEAIKSNIDLVEYIGDKIDLKRHGNNWSGLCPFHNDYKTPSFSVKDNHWQCFGCHKYGDVIEFHKLWFGQSFTETVQNLAEQIGLKFDGIELSATDPWLKAMKKAIQKPIQIQSQRLNEAAVNEYKKYQHEMTVREGWLPETTDTFGIGYCGDQYDYELYDRITIPIRDIDGHLIGFSGRKTNDNDDRKKYRFTHGVEREKLLYNLNLALPEIRQKREIVICEGYWEVLRSWEAGVKNVVALMGTACAPSQFRLILRHSKNVILALDNDEPGQIATKALGDELRRFCQVRVAKLPNEYKDFGEIRDYDLIHKAIYEAKEF
jgi:DNA primase